MATSPGSGILVPAAIGRDATNEHKLLYHTDCRSLLNARSSI